MPPKPTQDIQTPQGQETQPSQDLKMQLSQDLKIQPSQSQEPQPPQTQEIHPPNSNQNMDPNDPWSLATPNTHVSLTYAPLSITHIVDRVRTPRAGAIVMFAGTTRDNFDGKPVATLRYTSYIQRALLTLSSIATSLAADSCEPKASPPTTTTTATTPPTTTPLKIAICHRLGPVPIGAESIVIAVSSAHRAAAWRAAEAALEECKRRVEVWKTEVFADTGEAVWRANREWGAGGEMLTSPLQNM